MARLRSKDWHARRDTPPITPKDKQLTHIEAEERDTGITLVEVSVHLDVLVLPTPK